MDNCLHCGKKFHYQGWSSGECPTKGCPNYKPPKNAAATPLAPHNIIITTRSIRGAYDPNLLPWDQKYNRCQDITGLVWAQNSDDPTKRESWENPLYYLSEFSGQEREEYFNITYTTGIIGPPSAASWTAPLSVLLCVNNLVGVYYKDEASRKAAFDWFLVWSKKKRGYTP